MLKHVKHVIVGALVVLTFPIWMLWCVGVMSQEIIRDSRKAK